MSDDIRGYFQGDALDLPRTVPGVPPADPITRARFILKRHWWDADNQALILKDIDPTNVASGQVTQTGSAADGNGTGLLIFHLYPNETQLVTAEVLHYYDVRVWLSSGAGFTVQPVGSTRYATALFKRRVGVAIV